MQRDPKYDERVNTKDDGTRYPIFKKFWMMQSAEKISVLMVHSGES